MIRLFVFSFFCFGPFSYLAYATYAGYPWTSEASYREYKAQKKGFERQQQAFLMQYRNRTKMERQDEDSAYLLEFYSQIDRNSDWQDQPALKTPKELAYLNHQRRNQAVENLRSQAFLQYTKNYQDYQKKQKRILSVRLKKIQTFRQQTPFYDPIF